MEKEYEDFVDEFQQKLREVTGYGEDRIFYKRKDEYPPTEGDRIFVNRVVEDEVTEVCALYAGCLLYTSLSGTGYGIILAERCLPLCVLITTTSLTILI